MSKIEKYIVTKNELIRSLAELNNVSSKVVHSILRDYQRSLLLQLKKNGEAKLLDLGKLRVLESSARIATNPKTGEKVQVPAKKLPKASFGRKTKEFIAGNETLPSFDF